MEAWAGAGGLLVYPYREIDMETRIFSKKDIEEAARVLKAGGLVAFPTETVFYDPLSYSVSCHTGPNAFGMGVSVRWEPGMKN